ncbi:hypothetical protein ACFE04_024103 [Oxalis oulophora]
MRCLTTPTKLLPIFHYKSHSLQKPICSSSSLPQITHKAKTPLFLKPLSHSTTPSNLKKWHNWAKNLTFSIGSTFVDQDNGPDSTLLLRELNWLIQDCCEHGTNSLSCESDVKLRVDIDELYTLWKQRIEERRPFQYIVGCEHWRDLVLSVEEGVLIPRPETELLVDFVNDVVESDCGGGELKDGLWADLGTGSGAIGIGIGRVLRKYNGIGKVVAIDLSPVAVEVARLNVHRYGLQDIVDVRLGSWYQPLKFKEEKLAGLVSNPPYIPSNQISGLQAEVGKHEPRLALDGGVDGMDDLLHLSNGAVSLLKPGGFFAFENEHKSVIFPESGWCETNGDKQSEALAEFMDKKLKGSFCNVKLVSDLAGVRRFVTGFRQ